LREPNCVPAAGRIFRHIRNDVEIACGEQVAIFLQLEACVIERLSLIRPSASPARGPEVNISAALGAACARKIGNMRR
jgi:hypothetical protein